MAISYPLSPNRGIAVLSPLRSLDHLNSVSVHAAKNPAVSQVVHLTATLPALTSRAGTSLSFVLLTSPATPSSHMYSQAPCFSVVHARRFSVWSHARSQAHVLSLLSCRCLSMSLASSPVQVATPSQHPSTLAPSSFHLSSNICAQIHSSTLHTSILSTGDVRL